MSAKTTSEMLYSEVSVFTGVAGAVAGTPVGYILKENTVDVTVSRTIDRTRVQGRKLPVVLVETERGLVVTTPLAQVNVDLLALCLGVTKDGNKVYIGDDTDNAQLVLPQFSAAFIAKDIAGNTVRLDIPYASSVGDLSLALNESKSSMPFEIEAIDGGSVPFWTFGAAAIDVTIAGGAITRTGAYHRVSGEGAAADTLDKITAADLVDNEFVRLQIKNATMPILLDNNNAGGTPDDPDGLFMFGDADWDSMTKTTDIIDFQYDLANTKWNEVFRYDDPA